MTSNSLNYSEHKLTFKAHNQHHLNNTYFIIEGTFNNIQQHITLELTYFLNNHIQNIYSFNLPNKYDIRRQFGFNDQYCMIDIYNFIKSMYFVDFNIKQYTVFDTVEQSKHCTYYVNEFVFNNFDHCIIHACSIKWNNDEFTLDFHLPFLLCRTTNTEINLCNNTYLFLKENNIPTFWKNTTDNYLMHITTTTHSINITLVTLDDNKSYSLIVDNNYLSNTDVKHFTLQAVYEMIVLAYNNHNNTCKITSFDKTKHKYYCNIKIIKKCPAIHRVRLHLFKTDTKNDWFNFSFNLVFQETPSNNNVQTHSDVFPVISNNNFDYTNDIVDCKNQNNVSNKFLFSCLKYFRMKT